MAKPKADKNGEAPKEQTRKRGRTAASALLIKSKEGKLFAEVLSEIHYKTKPEDNEIKGSFLRKTKRDRVLVELGLKTTNKSYVLRAANGLLRDGSGFSLQISNLSCHAKRFEV